MASEFQGFKPPGLAASEFQVLQRAARSQRWRVRCFGHQFSGFRAPGLGIFLVQVFACHVVEASATSPKWETYHGQASCAERGRARSFTIAMPAGLSAASRREVPLLNVTVTSKPQAYIRRPNKPCKP